MITAALFAAIVASAAPLAAEDQPSGVAVVELFTSEGCSSCPPADRLLGRILADAGERGQAVMGLSFHVDYWDRLGWRDRFSDAVHTERQRAYAEAFNARSIYTPQMIVNGRVEFIGSDARRADAAIADALSHPAEVRVSIEPSVNTDGRIRVGYSLSAAPDDAALIVAIVQPRAHTDVKRGENAGRALTHVNVVRGLSTTATPHARGDLILDLPADLSASDARVVAWVQHRKTLHVLGAAESPIAQQK